MKIEQWDIVRFRINANDRDLHPGVVVSPVDWCANEQRSRINLLACSKQVPAEGVKPHQVLLNGADGLDFASACGCEFFYVVDRMSCQEKIGRVGPVRRRQIGRKLNEVFRFPLQSGWNETSGRVGDDALQPKKKRDQDGRASKTLN